VHRHLLSLSIAAIGLFGGSFLNDKGVQETVLALTVTPLIGIFAFLQAAELERDGKFQTLALVGIACNVAGTIATITLAIHGFSYMSIAYAQWMTVGAQALILNIIGHRYTSYRLVTKLGVASAISGLRYSRFPASFRSPCEFPTAWSDACSGSARLEFTIVPAGSTG
jgi:hypothetical protein